MAAIRLRLRLQGVFAFGANLELVGIKGRNSEEGFLGLLGVGGELVCPRSQPVECLGDGGHIWVIADNLKGDGYHVVVSNCHAVLR